MSTSTTSQPTRRSGGTNRTMAVCIGAMAAIAAAINLITWLVARTQVDFVVRRDLAEATMIIGPVNVTLVTLAAYVLGGLLLLVVARRTRQPARSMRVIAWIGLGAAVLSAPAPLSVIADGGTRAALALMHVFAGVVWFVGLRQMAARSTALGGRSSDGA